MSLVSGKGRARRAFLAVSLGEVLQGTQIHAG